mmetsp:Transcript_28289/g.52715  ORF Transcript_28289/g.52715 Transcript_28289/m.52715 type:complete len:213 (-) Transcript_28289:293-931(-)
MAMGAPLRVVGGGWGKGSGRGVRGPVELLPQALQALGQGNDLVELTGAGAGQLGRDVQRLVAQLATLGCQEDVDTALVVAGAPALQMAQGLQALQQRCQRARVERQSLAELRHAGPVRFPQQQHHEVLRIGKAERRQQWLVDAGHGQRAAVERKAKLAVELQPFRAGIRGGCWGLAAWHGRKCRWQLNCTQVKWSFRRAHCVDRVTPGAAPI